MLAYVGERETRARLVCEWNQVGIVAALVATSCFSIAGTSSEMANGTPHHTHSPGGTRLGGATRIDALVASDGPACWPVCVMSSDSDSPHQPREH